MNRLTNKGLLLILALCLWASGARAGNTDVTIIGPSTALSTDSTVSVTTTSGTVLAVNSLRKTAYICNDGATSCYISLSGTAVAHKGILLTAGGVMVIDATNLYRGIITAVTASGTTTLSVEEGQ